MKAFNPKFNCSAKCRHPLVWITTPEGKSTQVRECMSARHVALNAAAVASLRAAFRAPLPVELIALVAKAVRS